MKIESVNLESLEYFIYLKKYDKSFILYPLFIEIMIEFIK